MYGLPYLNSHLFASSNFQSSRSICPNAFKTSLGLSDWTRPNLSSDFPKPSPRYPLPSKWQIPPFRGSGQTLRVFFALLPSSTLLSIDSTSANPIGSSLRMSSKSPHLPRMPPPTLPKLVCLLDCLHHHHLIPPPHTWFCFAHPQSDCHHHSWSETFET